ncbi:hypothetical protein PGT21_029362 [Puccinia graminis f. sp. tritici]|uniref:Uncharacterized protein n=1 Tax=Puccinia graminis f. sp. tritici TaxID=56615 RepID=A0A5B0LRA1_PUCGR|nr:hypothetical protein PGT21_029362 [Puccinia graminis f. sp. tritici]KAA1128305.1 hypothetical protein PGTUg99_003605 [Puccinia graminis f. sp. tritici]
MDVILIPISSTLPLIKLLESQGHTNSLWKTGQSPVGFPLVLIPQHILNTWTGHSNIFIHFIITWPPSSSTVQLRITATTLYGSTSTGADLAN